MLSTLWQDVRLAIRSARQGGWVTAVATTSLAVGIAANTTIFSLVQAVEFPRLPYPESSRIMFVESRNDERGLDGMPVSAPDAGDLAAVSRTIAATALTADQSSILRLARGSRRVTGRRVTPGFFEILGLPPAFGRTQTAADGPEAIVLSDRLWRAAFGGDPSILGRSIALDGGSVTVIGVMPEAFDPDAEFWTALGRSAASHSRDDRQFMLFARLKPSATVNDAVRELAEISTRLATEHAATNRGWIMVPIPIAHLHGRDSRAPFLLLQAAVGVVLLIACANIANILLAQGTRRRHEMAVRVSLGASRATLVRSVLTESVVLACAGGAFGLLLSMWGVQLASAVGGFPDAIRPELNPLVLAFTMAVSGVTGIVCGIVPAVRASAVAPERALRESRRGAGSDARGRLRDWLAAAQVAAALVLTVCAVLMLRSLANRHHVELGFDPRAAVRGEVMFSGERYMRPVDVASSVDQVLERLRSDAQVVAAGALTWALPTAAGARRQLTLPRDADRAVPGGGIDAVTPEYFSAMAAPLKRGRAFLPSDRAGSLPVAIVNEELARHVWPDRDPIGELLRLGATNEPVPVVTIVGVVSSMRRSQMHDRPLRRVYVPLAQHPNPGVTFVVRTRGDLAAAARLVEAAVQQVDPNLVVDRLGSMEADVAAFVAPARLVSTLLLAFGATGVMLAAFGIFGTISYTVAQRQGDLAIRAALGADQRDLLRLVLRSALRIAVTGLAVGIAAALLATRMLESFLFGVSAIDPLTYALAAPGLLLIVLAACYRPARAAATTDPLVVLRQ